MTTPRRCLLSLTCLLLAACIAPGAPLAAGSRPAEEPVAPLSRPGDGSPVCGLGKTFHAGRRELLRQRLAEQGAHGLVLMRGLGATRGYTEFRQDKAFWYLTGIESPGASLIMDLDSDRELLFLPEPDAAKEGWEGELWDSEDAWVPELTGFREVHGSQELSPMLRQMLGESGPGASSGSREVWISLAPYATVSGCFDRASPADRAIANDPLDGRPSREQALAGQLEESFGAKVADLSPVLGEMRRVKTEQELAAMRRAAESGARAMREAIASSAPGVGEWELDSLLGFEQQLQGADGMAYHAIVGSGANSTVLHYSASSRRMRDGELLLVDAGPELDHYTTDITRTWPVNGHFTKGQAELYDAVLAAQQAGIDAVRPGVTMADISDTANGVLRERGYGDMIRHGVCHYVGLEVHDTGGYSTPLEPGVVITVEPGAYDEARGWGVRIEDVIVVTADGCEVITRGVPVEREAMERLAAQRGLLEGS